MVLGLGYRWRLLQEGGGGIKSYNEFQLIFSKFEVRPSFLNPRNLNNVKSGVFHLVSECSHNCKSSLIFSVYIRNLQYALQCFKHIIKVVLIKVISICKLVICHMAKLVMKVGAMQGE